LKSAECDIALGPSGSCVADDTNIGTELRLTEREVMNMTEETAHRGVHAVQYSEVQAHGDQTIRKEWVLLVLSIRTGV
jgi:hypothetical protein